MKLKSSVMAAIALLALIAGGPGAEPVALAAETTVVPSPRPLAPSPTQEAGQEEGTSQEEGEEQGEQETEVDAPEFDASVLPTVDEQATDEQEAALRLVESILAEQQQLLSGQNFIYQAEARRDPFRSLLQARRREIAAPEQRPAGLPGFLITEVSISAIARAQHGWQAMIVGLDGRTYFIEVGAVLYDGRVVEISGDEVVFEQDVEDLMGARSTRRVSKRMVTGTQE